MKKSNLFLVIFFVLYIGGFFILNIFTTDVVFSPLENRNLEQKPEFSYESLLNGEFAPKYETYVTDQFAFRDEFVAIKSNVERLFGKLENNDVYISTENTLIDKASRPDYENVDKKISFVNRLEENATVPVYNIIIPTQNDIYQEKLPANAPIYLEKELIDYIDERVMNPIDIYSALWEHRDEYIFYNTDHHWTSLGAYYAYEAIMEALGKTPTPIGESVVVADDFDGTIFAKSGVRFVLSDKIEIYTENYQIEIEDQDGTRNATIYDYDKLLDSGKYQFFTSGDQPVIRISGNGEGKILLVKDSYTNALAPFLVDNFEEIHLIDLRFMINSVSEYALTHEINEILLIHSATSFQNEMNFAFLR